MISQLVVPNQQSEAQYKIFTQIFAETLNLLVCAQLVGKEDFPTVIAKLNLNTMTALVNAFSVEFKFSESIKNNLYRIVNLISGYKLDDKQRVQQCTLQE